MSEHTTPPDPSRRPTPAPIPHITTVRSALQEATNDATELGDLMASALAADDQQRHATGRDQGPAPRATRDSSDQR